jgi:hypothetical protein
MTFYTNFLNIFFFSQIRDPEKTVNKKITHICHSKSLIKTSLSFPNEKKKTQIMFLLFQIMYFLKNIFIFFFAFLSFVKCKKKKKILENFIYCKYVGWTKEK